MFRKLFGETEQEQIHFLHTRVIATIMLLVVTIIAVLLEISGLNSELSGTFGIVSLVFAIIMLFVWGWPVVKRLGVFCMIGTILSKNVIVGVILFTFLFIFMFYFAIILGFIGIMRYIYLRIKYR